MVDCVLDQDDAQARQRKQANPNNLALEEAFFNRYDVIDTIETIDAVDNESMSYTLVPPSVYDWVYFQDGLPDIVPVMLYLRDRAEKQDSKQNNRESDITGVVQPPAGSFDSPRSIKQLIESYFNSTDRFDRRGDTERETRFFFVEYTFPRIGRIGDLPDIARQYNVSVDREGQVKHG